MRKIPIYFFSEDISFILKKKTHIRKWVSDVISFEKYALDTLNFIFCSDKYLLQINIRYLRHDTYTDVITFDHAENANVISGDIFISIDRIKENALKYDAAFDSELKRVIIHGVLHLLGYKDKQPSQKEKMRYKEDQYLLLYSEK